METVRKSQNSSSKILQELEIQTELLRHVVEHSTEKKTQNDLIASDSLVVLKNVSTESVYSVPSMPTQSNGTILQECIS